jgi:hypothetical protein
MLMIKTDHEIDFLMNTIEVKLGLVVSHNLLSFFAFSHFGHLTVTIGNQNHTEFQG